MTIADISPDAYNPKGLSEEQLQARLQDARNAFQHNDPVRVAELVTEIAAERPLAQHPIEILLDDAIATFRRADILPVIERCQALAPQDARLWDTMGNVLTQLGRHRDALNALEKALEIRPGNHNTRTLMTVALFEAGRDLEAIAITRALAQENPDGHGVWSNLASMLVARGEFDEALMQYQRAIRLKPDDARIRLNYSIGLLKAGRFTQGWAEHEWRMRLPGHTDLPGDRLLPNITSTLDLRGKRVLVTQEEGLGDTLMYLRYLAPLARRGAIVRVWGAETLDRLTSRVKGVAETQVGGTLPPYDYHCPFISLPRAFAGTDTPFGDPVPYITADRALSARWARRLAPDRNLRVGIVWAGAPRPENTGAYMVDRRRSMPLSVLAPLTRVRGVTLYSLQKGDAARQLATFPGHVVDLMDEVRHMDDTAALIDNLDVVVSVDTSVVHLAGGMGCDVILMDRVNNCWRWLHGRDDSPWYPQMRIIRQTRHQVWDDVVRRVCADLRARVSARRAA